MKCFDILQISPTKDKKEIKKAFALQSKKFHPEEDKEAFLMLQNAYQEALQYAQKQTSEITYEVKVEESDKDVKYKEASFYQKEIRNDSLFNDDDVNEVFAAKTYVTQQCSSLPKKMSYSDVITLLQNNLLKRQLVYPEAAQLLDQQLVKKKIKLKKNEAIHIEKLIANLELPLFQKQIKKITDKNRTQDIVSLIIGISFIIGLNIWMMTGEEEVKTPSTSNQQILEDLYQGIQLEDHKLYDKDGNFIHEYDTYELGYNALILVEHQEYFIYDVIDSTIIPLKDIQEAHFIDTADHSQYYVVYQQNDKWYLISKHHQEPTKIENDYAPNTKIIFKNNQYYFEKSE